MFGALKRGADVLREAWLLSRVPPHDAIFSALGVVAEKKGAQRNGRGVRHYLIDYPSIGEICPQGDWSYDAVRGEYRLPYSNSLFAPGCLRWKPGRNEQDVLVFLPGYMAGAEDVLDYGRHPQNMRGVAEELGMGLACWDWPLQGSRLNGCLYRGLRSVYSAEREYSRILPSLGTSLWREYVAELQFALEQIRRHLGAGGRLHVVGWSMGGCFAYVAPLLGTEVASAVSAGSCASVCDLIHEGKTRLHGHFFYPGDGLRYFDLDDVVAAVLSQGTRLSIVHGDRDQGCLARTRLHLRTVAARCGAELRMDVLPDHGHNFSPTMEQIIMNRLREAA